MGYALKAQLLKHKAFKTRQISANESDIPSLDPCGD